MRALPVDLDLFNSFWYRSERERPWSIYKSAIRQARAFTLDDSTVEMIAEMAFKGSPLKPATERRLDAYRTLARLPYPYMWMEYDYRVLDRWLTKKGIPHDRPVFGKPERVGYFMDRIESTTGKGKDGEAFRFLTLGRMQDPTAQEEEIDCAMMAVAQSVTSGPLKLILHPHPKHSPAYKQAVHDGNQLGVSNAVAWGLMTPNEHVDMGRLEDVNNNALYMTGAVEPEEMWMEHLRGKSVPWSIMMRDSIVEQSLDLRFVVTALALMNHAPVRYVPYRRAGFARPRIEQRPFLSTSIVIIDVPRSRSRIKDINNHLKSRAGGWHNRRHEVRGHWRVADKEISDKWERFFDPMEEKYRWRLWIKEHQRGDSEIGYVQQFHSVQAGKL